MSINVTVPKLPGESITEGVIAEWTREVGDHIEAGEVLVVIETDKITVDVEAEVSGVIKELKFEADDEVKIGDVIAIIEPGAGAAAAPSAAPVEAPAAEAPAAAEAAGEDIALSPAVHRLVEEYGVDPAAVTATGPGGRLLKGDVQSYIEANNLQKKAIGGAAKPAAAPAAKPAPAPAAEAPVVAGAEPTERVKMTRLRQTIARRLVEAQHNAAMLTTFNEIDMSEVIALRTKYKDAYLKKYGVKLGFTAFFVKAAIEALKAYPAVNAEIDGTDIVYKNYFHIGIAVGGGRGLVVPNIRHADQLSFADVELELKRLAGLARDNRLSLDDLMGGTFTISNGGVYGSMLSTPILNPPQSGILGLHNIVERPVVVDGEVVIRPIMYVALTYDHRIIDGREAVSFLVRIKECIENPERIMLEI